MTTLTQLLHSCVWLFCRLTGLGVIASVLVGAALYVRIHSRPTGVFDPRLTSTVRLQEARLGFRQQVLDFQNALREFQAAELRLTEEQVNAVLYADAEYVLGVFGLNMPAEARELQVAFRPDRLVLRFEYVGPDVGPVMISASGGLLRSPDGSYRGELGDFHVGRQVLPVETALKDIFERFRKPGPSEPYPTTSSRAVQGRDSPVNEPTRVGRELLERITMGYAVGPVLELPKLPGTRRALLVRLEEFRLEEGSLHFRLVPVGFAGEPTPGSPNGPPTGSVQP